MTSPANASGSGNSTSVVAAPRCTRTNKPPSTRERSRVNRSGALNPGDDIGKPLVPGNLASHQQIQQLVVGIIQQSLEHYQLLEFKRDTAAFHKARQQQIQLPRTSPTTPSQTRVLTVCQVSLFVAGQRSSTALEIEGVA